MSLPLIDMAGEGVGLTPKQMGARLAELTASGDVKSDYYGDGGPVTELETALAGLLGKERAVMMPTGTLANMLAMRLMADGPGPRVLVHRDSHLFNDAGENITLAGKTMVPLVSKGASYSVDQVEAEIARTRSARVQASVGAIAIETPNRRHANRMFDPAERQSIEALARAEGVPLFLDAARIFIEAEWTERSPAEIAAPYDFVYVSLYKYLTAPFGAVLLGPSDKLEGLFHERRRFGGGLWQMWPAAILALDALHKQQAEWQAARLAGESVFAALAKRGLDVERFELGSNGVAIAVADDASLTARAQQAGLKIAPAANGKLTLKTNYTWTRDDPDAIAQRLNDLLRASSD